MENETQKTAKKMSPMLIGGIVVLIIILVGIAFFIKKKSSDSLKSVNVNEERTEGSPEKTKEALITPTSPENAPAAVKSFEVDGTNFKFSPKELAVNVGDTVRITFKNTQGMHNFMLDEFNAKSKTIKAGEEDVLEFVATKKGAFEFYCSVGTHRTMGMVGTLTVN